MFKIFKSRATREREIMMRKLAILHPDYDAIAAWVNAR